MPPRVTAATRLGPGALPSEVDVPHCGDFDAVYRLHYADVVRWCRALGGADMDLEDLAQETFLVVRRKLASFDGVNLGGWLYRIAALTVRRARRRAWLRQVLLGRAWPFPGGDERETDKVPGMASGPAPPDAALDRREQAALLHRLLDCLSGDQRAAFLLFEVEGYSIEQIAALQRVKSATVSTRLFYSRRKLARRLARLRRAGGLE